MNASTEQPPIRKTRPAPRVLDLQQIFSWLLADGIIEKTDTKAHFNHAQGLLRSGTASAGAGRRSVAVSRCVAIALRVAPQLDQCVELAARDAQEERGRRNQRRLAVQRWCHVGEVLLQRGGRQAAGGDVGRRRG